jgi:hypothetical protein
MPVDGEKGRTKVATFVPVPGKTGGAITVNADNVEFIVDNNDNTCTLYFGKEHCRTIDVSAREFAALATAVIASA